MNAKEYRKLAEKKQSEVTVHDVTLPSGAVWKLKEPPIQQFLLAGKVPTALAAKMAKVVSKKNSGVPDSSFVNDLSVDELLDCMAFGRDLLLHCAVSPKISLNPTSDDEIAPEDILPDDFSFLTNWVMKGGNSGDGLSNFRPE